MYAGTQYSTGTQHRDGQGWWRSTGRLAAVIVLGLALASPAPGQAKTFHCGAGDVDCLIDAINEANANGNKNTIRLAAGIYTLTEAYNGTTDDPNGLPVVTSPLTIIGAGAATTSIERAASAPDFRLLEVAATGTLTLSRLTFSGGGGRSLRVHDGFRGGGGIVNYGTLTLTSSALTGNGPFGGGIFDGFDGGGIANYGTLTVTSSALTGNGGGHEGAGGGIANYGTLTLTHSALTGNGAFAGGGGLFNAGTATLTNATLTSNGSGFGGGSGIANYSGTLTLTDSTLTDNTSTGHGGGLINIGTATLTNATLIGNTSTGIGHGGGLFNAGTMTLTNCTLTGNTSGNRGGGGGIANDGSMTLQNTIVAFNTAPLAVPLPEECVGDVISLGTNLIGDPNECPITLQPSDRTGDPGFGDFTDNGSPGNGHIPLLPGSPAIDAGNDAVCPTRDQLGRPRMNISGVGTSRCDIGAIEFQHRNNQQRDEALATIR